MVPEEAESREYMVQTQILPNYFLPIQHPELTTMTVPGTEVKKLKLLQYFDDWQPGSTVGQCSPYFIVLVWWG